MPNRLGKETSPYLLQHAGNPVDWFPWGRDAFEAARSRDVPIFLSIGYSTCHWCHVMAHESFENEAVAKVLNEHFVSIKLDREERPDVDRVYMAYLQALAGQGGWPLSVWLTPDLKPFYAGTYFPPADRQGRAGFSSILRAIAKARVVVLVFSAASNTSPQVLREIERAVHNGTAIIPFRIEDVPFNESLEFFISTPHWLDALTPPLEAHAARLAESVKSLLGHASV